MFRNFVVAVLTVVVVFWSAGVAYAQQPLPAAYGSGVQVNSVRTWTARKPIQNESDITSSGRSVQEVIQATNYADGLGRPLESVAKQISPAGNDVVTPFTYDSYGREQFKYLSFVSNGATGGDVTNDGNFKFDLFQQQAAFYNTYLNGQPGEAASGSAANWAYSQDNYEISPLNRVNSSYGPGVNLVGSQGSGTPHGRIQQYLVNTATDNVQMWNIGAVAGSIPTSAGAYPAGALQKTIVTDEQGHQTIEFRDMYKQLILRKIQETAPADNGTGSAHSGWECVYYVFDDFGNNRYIITPAEVRKIDGTWSIAQTDADELCYRLEYDIQGRMIIKKMPGTAAGSLGEQWTVYDSRNRPVMTQDGNLRSLSQWLVTLYDGLDRPVTTGTMVFSGDVNGLQAMVNQQTTVGAPAPPGIASDLTLNTTTSGDYQASNSITLDVGFITVDGGAFSATVYGNPTAGTSTVGTVLVSLNPLPPGVTLSTLTATFYDDYSWLAANGSPFSSQRSTSGDGQFTAASNTTAPYPQALTQSNMVIGQVTGRLTTVPGGTQTLYDINFFDEYHRMIQSQATNYTGGTDITTRQFDFASHLLADYVQHQKSGANAQTHAVLTKKTYDALGRLLTMTKTVSSTVGSNTYTTPTQTIVSITYDEMGRLKQKTLGTNMETLQYDYNVRGALLGINRAYAKSAGSTANYFGLDLGYDNGSITDGSGSSIGSYVHPTYNGSISGVVWKSRGDNQIRKYDYSYDVANRLTGADFNQQSGGFNKTAGIDFSVVSVGYDVNGNMSGLNQNGWLPGGSQNIDNLSYQYLNGNSSYRLQYVADNSGYNGSNPQSALGDFHYAGSKTSSSNDYSYDANGNITSDANRLVSAITYSYLNKPTLFTITGKGSVKYVYDAMGVKLQKVTTDNSVQGKTVTTTTTYVGGFVYKSRTTSPADVNNPDYTDVLQYIANEEGRIRFKPPVGSVAGSYVFDYYIRDQQNSVRMVLTDEQQQDIYPAATIETAAIGTESNYYNIVNDAAHVVPVTSLSWYNAMSGSGYNNSNGSIANPGNPNPTGTSANVYKLNGQTGDKYGLGITLKVMAGDQVSIFAKSFWHNTGAAPGSFPINSVLSSFVAAFGATPAVSSSIHGGSLSGLSSPSGPLSTMVTGTPNQPNPTVAPKAAINWILFDDQFNPVSVGTDLVSSTGDIVNPHSKMNIPMTKNGYLYVYCSNESDIDVYFDNLQVIDTRGPILEETHYYPTGLAMAGISDRAWNKQSNFMHYQGMELQGQEFGDGTSLDEYDFAARYYDQQLGVWHNQDPAAQFASPYLAMAYSWPNGVDPSGKSWLGNILKAPFQALEIVAGLFAYNSHQTVLQNLWDDVSRVTWQLPQEAVGLFEAEFVNAIGFVNSVSYYDGATVLKWDTKLMANSTTELLPGGYYSNGGSGAAFTLGSFINGPSHMETSPSDPTFAHEYGRYLQSQAEGWIYLGYTAIPNFIWGGNDDATSHDANARALIYFEENHGPLKQQGQPGPGFYWDFRDTYGDPIPGYNPNWSFYDLRNQAALNANMR